MHLRDDLNGLRIAIYARYSSDKQNDASVDDQIRRCREHVAARGGSADPRLVFEDRAESGSSLARGGGIEALLGLARARAIDCIVVEDISRLTRNLADGSALYREFAFLGVRVIAVADGLDTREAGAHLPFNVKLLMSDFFLHDLRDKTRRGLVGRAHAGLVTGLLPYGYRSEPDPASSGKRVVIDDERAAIVRRIFGEAAAGRTQAEIARRLNADGIAAPRGNGTRKRQGWVLTGVRAILLNEKYLGIWKFNEREFVKVPGTKRRVSRKRPERDVITKELPHLRIVSDETWALVQQRFADNRARYRVAERKPRSSFGRAGKPSSYLLSGLLVCGVCGAPMTLHGGGEGRRYYRCDDNAKRGTCDNALSVREAVARECILTGLRDTLLSSDAVAYVRKRIAEKLGEIARSGSAQERQLRDRLGGVEARMERLAEALASGVGGVEIVAAKLRDEDAKAKALRAELAAAEAVSRAPVRLPTPDDVLRVVADLDRVLQADVAGGREALRRLLRAGTIRLVPGADRIYTAEAEVLPFGLLLASPRSANAASVSRDGARYTTVDCGGRI